VWDHEILPLRDGSILVQCGPMRMFIEAQVGMVKQPDLSRAAGKEAISFLERIAAGLAALKVPAVETDLSGADPLVETMWRAALAMDSEDLTPMAAVAGTIADATADYLERRGMTRVVVNNGGDIAFRLKGDGLLSIGIREKIEETHVGAKVTVEAGMNLGGAATSGLGGRSLTRGVADAATVLAKTAALADAAATTIANATYVESPEVERVPANKLDTGSDLGGLMVTARVGRLRNEEIERALDLGIAKAQKLVDSGAVFGACVAAQGRMRATAAVEALLRPVSQAT